MRGQGRRLSEIYGKGLRACDLDCGHAKGRPLDTRMWLRIVSTVVCLELLHEYPVEWQALSFYRTLFVILGQSLPSDLLSFLWDLRSIFQDLIKLIFNPKLRNIKRFNSPLLWRFKISVSIFCKYTFLVNTHWDFLMIIIARSRLGTIKWAPTLVTRIRFQWFFTTLYRV